MLKLILSIISTDLFFLFFLLLIILIDELLVFLLNLQFLLKDELELFPIF